MQSELLRSIRGVRPITIGNSLIAVLLLSPVVWLFVRTRHVEFERAIELLVAAQTAEIFLNTTILVVGVVVCSVLIGVPLAVVLAYANLPYRRVLTALVALPLVIPSYIGAFALTATFGRHGEIDALFGISMPQIDGLGWAIFVITLYTYPYVFLTTRAALVTVDPELVDAARTLNAGRFEAFRRVVVPVIQPGIAAGVLLAALYAVSDFGTPAFLQVSVFTSAIYQEFEAFNVEYAALLSLQLLAITGLILALESGLREQPEGSGGGHPRIKLGAGRYLVGAVISLLVFVTLVVPLGIFTRWLLLGPTETVAAFAFDFEYVWNSVLLAGLAAVVAGLVAVPIGYAAVRSGTLLDRIIERSTYVGFAVPGVVVGLALVFFGSTYAPWLYQTVPLLVFAYVVRFLPQAVGTTRAATAAVDSRLEEAARTLNGTRLQVFRQITWPLIKPGVAAGGALVFLTTMKELPATLLLQPVGMETLVTIIWATHEAVYYRYAAIPAIVLVVVSGLSLLIVLRTESYGMR